MARRRRTSTLGAATEAKGIDFEVANAVAVHHVYQRKPNQSHVLLAAMLPQDAVSVRAIKALALICELANAPIRTAWRCYTPNRAYASTQGIADPRFGMGPVGCCITENLSVGRLQHLSPYDTLEY